MSLANIGKFKLSLKALILSVFTFICFLVFSNAFRRTKIFLKSNNFNLSLRRYHNVQSALQFAQANTSHTIDTCRTTYLQFHIVNAYWVLPKYSS